MAVFPSWISKRNNNNMNSQSLSPRQIANKAHNLAIKKLDRDDKRKKPQYSIRERLLLSHTMIKAEEILNKKPTMYRSAVSFDDDDIMPPFKKSVPVTAAANANEKTISSPPSDTKASVIANHESRVMVKEHENQPVLLCKNDSALPTLEQMAAVSIVVVSVVASLNKPNHPQNSSITSQDRCRASMIPSHSSYATII